MVLVMTAAVINSMWLVVFHPGTFALVVGLNMAIAVTAIAGYVGIVTVARRHVAAVVFTVLLVVDFATLGLGLFAPELGLVAAGYLLLLPTVVALVIPWPTRIHVTWLLVHATLVIGYAFFARDAALLGGGTALIGLLAVATTVSQFGHMSSLRSAVLGYLHVERIRALNRRLETSARTDELTGLKNRMGLKIDLGIVRSRIERHGERYGLLMLDLDRFKAVNDALGHVAGDRVLRATADAIAATLRPGDRAYRFGGEEFTVVMRVSQPREALMAAERIRRAVEELGIANAGNPPHGLVTISIGVAAVGRRDLSDPDDTWLGRADVALYRAKAMGRNRCEVDPSSIFEVEVEVEGDVPAQTVAELLFQTSATGTGRPSR